jgi:putative intracellular protease/amidase
MSEPIGRRQALATMGAVAASVAVARPIAGGAAAPAEANLPIRFERRRPLAVVVADNAGTETTDFMVPLGVLRKSGAFDVHGLGVEAGRIALMPALAVEADSSLAAFAAAHPDGADLVIVPALHESKSPAILDFVRTQYRLGAVVCGICAGGLVLANAGLLDGRAATTHWYELDEMLGVAANATHVPDKRYVADGRIVTTTGVTASLPVSLALVEAARGRAAADALASDLGVKDWSDAHDSEAFGLGARTVATALTGWAAFWSWRTYQLPIGPGVSEIALALTADALARTYRSSAVAVAEAPVRSANGLVVLPAADTVSEPENAVRVRSERPAEALDDALARIDADFGTEVANFVALQLEYRR